MGAWPTKPTWKDRANINRGNQYNAVDGVTANDMNAIVNNILYLRKYGGKVSALQIDASVSGTTLILKSAEDSV